MKKQIKFIVNPFSGIGKSKRLRSQIENNLDHSQYNYSIEYTKEANHATWLAREAVDCGIDLIVAVGGDGSVNEVSKALIGSNSALGIIPSGSGNGFAMHLGISRNPRKAIKQLNEGHIIKTDSCSVNGHHFVNLSGIGLQALIANKLKKSRFRGILAYSKFILQESFKYNPSVFEIEIDGKLIFQEGLLVEVANAPMFGYNFEIASNANLADGILEIIILKKLKAWQLPYLAWHSLSKSLVEKGLAINYSGKNIKINITTNTYAHFDGEGFTTQENLHYTIRKHSLNVLAPKKNVSN